MTAPRTSATADDGRTRDRVSGLLLEHGPQTAAELAALLGISPAAVRRHLDALQASGRVEERLEGGRGGSTAHRGRGRPARRFHLTDAGRSTFPHAYDDLALTALRYVAASGGPDAVRAVAEQQLAGLEERCSTAVEQATERGGGRPGRPCPGARRRADGRGLRCHGLGDLRRGAALPAPLPGGARGGGVPPALRGRDRGDRPARGHPRAAAGHHRPRRRDLHHTHPRTAASGEQIRPCTPCTR